MTRLRIALCAQAILATGCLADKIPAGSPCDVGDACQGAYVCLDGACRMPCNSDEVCARVETCRRGVCLPATEGGDFGDPAPGDSYSGDAGWGDPGDGGDGGPPGDGGGGDGMDGDAGPPPEVAILFPPAPSLTEADTIVVRGTASDDNGIASVTVAGVDATSDDGFATWIATVPLAVGDQVLAVSATDTAGARTADGASVSVRREAPLIYGASRLAHDASAGELVVVEDAANGGRGVVHRIDLGTGVRTAVPDPDGRVSGIRDIEIAGGTAYALTANAVATLDTTTGVLTDIDTAAFSNALAVDPTSQTAFVPRTDGVDAIDLDTGTTTEASGSGKGTGPLWTTAPSDACWSSVRGRLYVVTDFPRELYAVDATTGNRTIASSSSVGTGPTFGGFLLCETSPDRVASGGQSAGIVAVDLDTGNRTMIVDVTGMGFNFLRGLAHVGSEWILAELLGGRITALDPSGPTTRPLGLATIGSGQTMAQPDGMAEGFLSTGEVLVADRSHGIVAVDVADGTRRVVSNSMVGGGATWRGAVDLAISDGRVFGTSLRTVYEVELATGDRTIVSDDATGAGTALMNSWRIAADVAGGRIFASDESRILSIALANGDRTELTAFDRRAALALDLGGTALVAGAAVTVESIEIATGTRTTISGSVTGSGPNLNTINELVPTAHAFFVCALGNSSYGLVARVDRATGDRVALSYPTVGNGPPLRYPAGCAFDLTREIAFGASETQAAIFAIDMVSGDRVVISK